MILSTSVTDNVAVITGGSRGIGLAVARHFVGHGARVVINGIDPAEIDAAVRTLAGEAGAERVAGHAGDVSQLARGGGHV
jgi:NAD(P)-dependent dehydrogenase (short-subunit alcohol dehydrogenase family)